MIYDDEWKKIVIGYMRGLGVFKMKVIYIYDFI